MLALPFMALAQNPCGFGQSNNINAVFNQFPNADGIVVPAGTGDTGCGFVNNFNQATTLTIRNVTGSGPVIDIQIYSGTASDAVPVVDEVLNEDNSFLEFDFLAGPQNSRQFYGLETFYGAAGTFEIAITPFAQSPVDADFITVIVEAQALPVNWVDELDYRPFGEQIRLEYSVSDQVDVAGYELEAFNGDSFKKLKHIDYQENGALETRYSVLAQWPTEATYYRIKQLDHDGSYDYSNVIFVPGNEKAAAELMLFPNPASNTVRMTVPEGVQQIDLIDASGRLMQSYDAELARGGIDVSGVSEGMYFIRPVGAEGAATPQRLVIRH